MGLRRTVDRPATAASRARTWAASCGVASALLQAEPCGEGAVGFCLQGARLNARQAGLGETCMRARLACGSRAWVLRSAQVADVERACLSCKLHSHPCLLHPPQLRGEELDQQAHKCGEQRIFRVKAAARLRPALLHQAARLLWHVGGSVGACEQVCGHANRTAGLIAAGLRWVTMCAHNTRLPLDTQ